MWLVCSGLEKNTLPASGAKFFLEFTDNPRDGFTLALGDVA